MKGKFKSDDFIQKITDPLLDAKRNAENLLQKDLQEINVQYKNSLSGIINKIGDPSNLFNKETSSLRQQLLNTGYLKSIKDKENLYSQLIQKKNLGEKVDLKQLESLDSSLREEKGIESLLERIEEHKRRWDSSGLIKKMKEWNVFQKQSMAKFIQDPSTTIKAAKQFLNLNNFQKLFLKIDKLNLGENAFSLSPLSIEHFLNNGVVTQFLNNKHYLMLLSSKQQDYNSLLDIPYSNNISSNTGVAKSISYGTGMSSASRSHVTLASYTQTLSSINIPAALNSFRRSLVTTISNEMNIGKNGLITTEISRSSTDYVNDSAGQSGLKKVFSPDDFWKNTSFSVNYEDQYLKPNLSYQIHASKTANGYDNPGDIFLNSGSKEFGYAIKKTFWNKRLQVNVRSNLRQFKYNDLLNERWRSIYSVLDIRLKLKKGQYASLRYLPSKMIRLDSSSKSVATQINMLTAEANLTKKVMRGYYHNYLSLSSQKNGYSFNNEWVLTRTILFSSSQTLSVGKKLVYVNTNYNCADNHSRFVYFNSSFITEAGSSFILLKKLNASSSLTYNTIKGWYQQIGIRQTLSTQIAKRFNMSVYADARKNIHVYQPLWVGLFRADISIHYQLKN